MLERFARLGYASKALIYAIVGLLAILMIANRGGRVTDTSGALLVVLTQPFGRVLLVALAIGLCGYALWRVLDAARDPDRDGTTPHGLIIRIGNAARGCVYGALGLEAFRLVRGIQTPSGNVDLLAARIFAFPLGEFVVGIGAACIGAYGMSEIVGALRGRNDPKLDLTCFSREVRPVLSSISRFGVTVRGALLVTLALFLLRAAWTHDPNQAASPRESMLVLGGVFAGRWFLGIIAAGLLAYAVDQAVHARCRRIRPVL